MWNFLIGCWTMGECILKDELLDDTEMSCLLSRQLRLAHMFTSKKEEIGGTWEILLQFIKISRLTTMLVRIHLRSKPIRLLVLNVMALDDKGPQQITLIISKRVFTFKLFKIYQTFYPVIPIFFKILTKWKLSRITLLLSILLELN